MADERIEVEIVLDDGSIVKGFAKLNQEAEKSSDQIGRSFSRSLRNVRFDGLNRGLDRVKNSVFNLRNALVGGLAVIGAGALVREFTQLASIQQDAVNQLNNSLRTAGSFSEQASKDFQDFASSLQAISTVGDEVILNQLALARNFTQTNEEAQKLTSAALDLSAATGISLDSAVKNLGKTYAGLAGELGESVPALRTLTQEQLKAGAAIDLVAQRFGGSALSETRTFSGALTQLSNTVGDLFESFGSIITNSPVVVNLFNALSKTVQNLTGSLSSEAGGFDQFFKELVLGAAGFANAIIDSFEVLSQIPNFFQFVFTKAKLEVANFVQSFLLTIQPVAGFLDRVFGNTGASAAAIQQNFQVISDLEARLESLGEKSIESSQGFSIARAAVSDFTTEFQRLNVTANQAANNIPATGGGGSITPTIDEDLDELRTSVSQLQKDTQLVLQESFFNPEAISAGNPSIFEDLSNKGKEALQTLQAELVTTRDSAVQLSQQVGQAVKNGIANTIANSVSSVVDALRTGQNAFAAFGKAALATIGDLAVQLGQTLIAAGIGIDAIKVLGGAAAVAAGIALVAIGTLIKGVAAGASPNPSGGSSVTPPLADLEPDGVSDEISDRSRVNVTIEGNVFDSDETGLRIADILQNQGFNNAVVS